MPSSERTVGVRGYGAVAALVAVSYAITAAWSGTVGLAVVVVVQLVTLWLIFTLSAAARARRVVAAIAGAAVVVSVALVAGGAVSGSSLEDVAPVVLTALLAALYALSPLILVENVLRRRVVDGQAVLGAIAAYLLIGMAFAFVYVTVQLIQAGQPFFGDQGEATVGTSLFFSFTTLTTTGYGNLVPAGDPGQTLAIAEVVLGQIFLVTAVAKIVADFPGRRSQGQPR